MEAAFVIRHDSYALVPRWSWEVEKKEIVNQRLPVRAVSPVAPTANLRLCADEIGSFVRYKKCSVGAGGWRTRPAEVVAFVFGRRTHVTFRRLLVLLASKS